MICKRNRGDSAWPVFICILIAYVFSLLVIWAYGQDKQRQAEWNAVTVHP